MQVQSLGREDPLEESMATQSCLENPMDRILTAGALGSVQPTSP